MKRVLKIVMGLLFMALLVATFIFLWQKSQPKKIVYKLEIPKLDTLQRSAVATGNVEPRDEVLIKPQISGIISEVYNREGDMVKAGDIIAKIKIIPDMSSLSSAQSRVNQAIIDHDLAKANYDREKRLYDAGVVAKETFQSTESSYSKASEELNNAKENLEIVLNGVASGSAELSNTQIRATVTGMVLDVPIKVGNSVIQSNTFNDGTTIATIADLDDMVFNGKMDETEVGYLKEGMPVKITIGALQGVELDAELNYIAPKGEELDGLVQFEITATVDVPSDIFVRAGYSANAEIMIDVREGVLSIAEGCVIFEDGKTYVEVYTGEKDGVQEFSKREVTLGLSDGINVEITSGLTTEDQVKGDKVTEE